MQVLGVQVGTPGTVVSLRSDPPIGECDPGRGGIFVLVQFTRTVVVTYQFTGKILKYITLDYITSEKSEIDHLITQSRRTSISPI